MINRILIIIFFLAISKGPESFGSTEAISPSPPSLDIQIISSQTLSGTAGDYVTVEASIKNISLNAIDDVTTYLSLIDEETKLPVDLEDWSAEKGLFIGTIGNGQTLPLEWKIHFVKAGKYSLIIIAETAGEIYPQTSSIVHFAVAPKINLNPGHVLPVALITPVIILCIMLFVTYRRNSRLSD
jgi:hypothetical protein